MAFAVNLFECGQSMRPLLVLIPCFYLSPSSWTTLFATYHTKLLPHRYAFLAFRKETGGLYIDS